MSLISQASKEKEFDVRSIERNLAKGLMTHDQVTKNQKTLTDDSDNSEYFNTDEIYETIIGKSPLRES